MNKLYLSCLNRLLALQFHDISIQYGVGVVFSLRQAPPGLYARSLHASLGRCLACAISVRPMQFPWYPMPILFYPLDSGYQTAILCLFRHISPPPFRALVCLSIKLHHLWFALGGGHLYSKLDMLLVQKARKKGAFLSKQCM